MRRHPIPVVAACIIKQHPLRILLHKKNESKDDHGVLRNPELVGLWEFPGGMIEGKDHWYDWVILAVICLFWGWVFYTYG